MRQIAVQPAALSDKLILRHLLELCQHDYSEFNQEDVDEHGLFGYNYLDQYWVEPGRFPFLIHVAGKLAGFALVRTLEPVDGVVTRSLSEFFILRKFRRQHIGQEAAQRVFGLFPGQWRVSQEAANLPAQAFWRKTIDAYTQGDFHEVWLEDATWHGPVQYFHSQEVSS